MPAKTAPVVAKNTSKAVKPTKITKAPAVNPGTTPAGQKSKVSKPRKANFSIYIMRLLKATNKNMSIGSKALHSMNSITISLAKAFSDSVNGYITNKTITSQKIQDVVKFLLPDELAKHAISKACKSVSCYNASCQGSDTAKIDHRKRANIVFPPGLAQKFIRKFGKLSVRVGVTAGVYLAAVLEYIITEVLSLASAEATKDKRVRIKPRHILLGVSNDADMNELLHTKLQVVIPEGGVVPNIHPNLLVRNHAPRRHKKIEGVAHKHRFRPGTVALRNIRKQQKSASMQIQHAPFRRACMAIASQHTTKDKPRFGAEFLEILQEFVESRLVSWFEGANMLALHCGRQTVAVKDIHAFISLKNASLFPADESKSVQLSNEGLRRLSQRAGVKMIGAGTFAVVKQYIYRLLESQFRVMCQMLTRDHKKTFDSEHIKQALTLLGVTFAA